jgi:predicted RNase H-like HicB family nuclease
MTNNEIIFSVEESPEGGYEARALDFSIFTQANSLEELKTMIRDAVSCHFEDLRKDSAILVHSAK